FSCLFLIGGDLMFIINPADVEKEAIAQGVPRSELNIPSLVILTFNKAIGDDLFHLCNLKDWTWAGTKFTPYAPPVKAFKGKFNQTDIAVFVPPMGASPIISFCEELIFFGAKILFLLCASWGLGDKYLYKGQIHLPSFAIGLDGTSPHYGNKEWKVEPEPRTFKALATALNELGGSWKEGGVAACEALYRITPEMVTEFRKKGCLSMENGEVASLYSLAKTKNILIGVLLQPYIDLEQGWKTSYMDEIYAETCKLQARAALKAAMILLDRK
ncbi:MAG: hypothetical protein ACFFBD_27975, partial [Candidatus Hodarchaeota archaeon]